MASSLFDADSATTTTHVRSLLTPTVSTHFTELEPPERFLLDLSQAHNPKFAQGYPVDLQTIANIATNLRNPEDGMYYGDRFTLDPVVDHLQKRGIVQVHEEDDTWKLSHPLLEPAESTDDALAESLARHRGHTCPFCCRTLDRSNRVVLRIIPAERGGRDEWDNLVLACSHCEASRCGRSIPEWCADIWAWKRRIPSNRIRFALARKRVADVWRFLKSYSR